MNAAEQILLAIFTSSAFTGIVLKLVDMALDRWGKTAKAKRDAQSAALQKLEQAVDDLKEDDLVLMHDRIYQMFTELSKKDVITADDKANLDYVFERYTARGGNHRAESYYSAIVKKQIETKGLKYE